MKKAPFRRTEIKHHDDGSHTVEHFPQHKPMSKSGAFYGNDDPISYSAGNHKELAAKLTEHLGGKGGPNTPAAAGAAVDAAEEVDA